MLLEAQNEDIDWVLSDIVMPGISGIELTQIMGQRWPAMPLVLISSHSQTLAHDSSGFQVLRKPYSLEELVKALDERYLASTKYCAKVRAQALIPPARIIS